MTQDEGLRALATEMRTIAQASVGTRLAAYAASWATSIEALAASPIETPAARFDLLEDPARGLHAVLTRFGLASRTDFMPLVTALVHWAADAYRSSLPLSQNEQAWEDLRADGGLPEAQSAVPSVREPIETPADRTRFAWLLERAVDGSPGYWDGGHAESFTRDPNLAVQWARREDAMACCKPRDYAQWGWRYVEHGFMSAAVPSVREPLDETCGAEMCECGHFQCRHSGIWKGAQQACDDCQCLTFRAALRPHGSEQQAQGAEKP